MHDTFSVLSNHLFSLAFSFLQRAFQANLTRSLKKFAREKNAREKKLRLSSQRSIANSSPDQI